MKSKRIKVHINVRMEPDHFAIITKRAKQHKRDFTAELTDILNSALTTGGTA